MPIFMRPDTDIGKIAPTAGKILVEILDRLGRTTKGGLFIPGNLEDGWDRDTAYGKVLRMGPAPTVFWKDGARDVARDKRNEPLYGEHAWPAELHGSVRVGDIVMFPRDVPLVIVCGEKRYGLVLQHELLLATDEDVEIEMPVETRAGAQGKSRKMSGG